MRGFEQILANAVGTPFSLARFKPVSEKLHLNVSDAMVVEKPLHRRIANCLGVNDKILMNEAHLQYPTAAASTRSRSENVLTSD